MLLGLSGQAGSGKDTTADILVSRHGFVKVSLADPLKKICKEVYAFTDDQLWGPSEKRNEPDKRYLHKRAGALGSTDVRPWVTDGHVDFEGSVFRGLEHLVDQDGFLPCPPTDEYLTPRYALQRLGTEWGRDCYYNTWIDLAIRTATWLLEADDREWVTRAYSAKLGRVEVKNRGDAPCKGVVIPDVRFRNEIDAIHKAGGRVVRITRPQAGLSGAAGQHISETEQSKIPDSAFDFVITNDSSLQMLVLKTDSMMDHLNGRIRKYDEVERDTPPFKRP